MAKSGSDDVLDTERVELVGGYADGRVVTVYKGQRGVTYHVDMEFVGTVLSS